MSKLFASKTKDGAHHAWLFFCPGCKTVHFFDGRWSGPGDEAAPTFTPSLLVYGQPPNEETGWPGRPRCHSYVTAGRIQFLADSEHALAGQTVEIPEFTWGDD